MTQTLMFLPGASGNVQFWKPVSAKLCHPAARRFVAWPGFGGVPAEPGVRGIDDLVARVVGDITGPVALLAQSMGGIIAVRAALEKPSLVRHLVLSVTSGGIDVAALGAQDWRPSFRKSNPGLPSWFADERRDFTERLREITMPVLLLWGDADPISPVAVGRRLAQLFPRAELVVSREEHTTSSWSGRTRLPLTSSGIWPRREGLQRRAGAPGATLLACRRAARRARGGGQCVSESWQRAP